MKASDHMLKPSENTLHQRGHPHMKHANGLKSMGLEPNNPKGSRYD